MSEKISQLKLFNTTRDFCFPDEGNAATHIHNILTGNVYKPVQLKDFSPTRIIDIGANVGASAIYFHSQYPNAQVTCFEPSTKNFRYLTQNLQDINHITLNPFGLSDTTKITTLFQGKTQCLQYSIFKNTEVSESGEQIQLKAAFDEVKEIIQNQTVIKIDTEGCEFPILNSIKTLFNQLQVIYLEFHSEKDRIRIDNLLKQTHGLWNASVKHPHRGDVCYLHRSLWENNPDITMWEISGS